MSRVTIVLMFVLSTARCIFVCLLTTLRHNRPVEMSATKPVSRFRMVIPETKRKTLDPRFDQLFGPVNVGIVKQSYKFIEELEDREIRELQAAIRSENDETVVENLKKDLQRLVRFRASFTTNSHVVSLYK